MIHGHHSRNALKPAVPKTVVSRPIIKFDGMESVFLLVDSRPFWERPFWHVTQPNQVLICIMNLSVECVNVFSNVSITVRFYALGQERNCCPSSLTIYARRYMPGSLWAANSLFIFFLFLLCSFLLYRRMAPDSILLFCYSFLIYFSVVNNGVQNISSDVYLCCPLFS